MIITPELTIHKQQNAVVFRKTPKVRNFYHRDDVISDTKKVLRARRTPIDVVEPDAQVAASQRGRDLSERTSPSPSAPNGVRDYCRQGDPRADARVDARSTQKTDDPMRAREREQGAWKAST